MSESPSIIWFRLDLRLADQPALLSACRQRGPVIPVFIWAPEEEGDWPPGAASRWWLHQSLAVLMKELERKGSRLVLRKGKSLQVLREILRETGAHAIFWNRRYEPAIVRRDSAIEEKLKGDGVAVETFNGSLLFEPWEIETQQGGPYQVFSPFWKNCLSGLPPFEPEPEPKRIRSPKSWPKTLKLDDLGLEPEIDWAEGIRNTWEVGSKPARRRIKTFLERKLESYHKDRDRIDLDGSSRLSPYLHFGEISPRQVWESVQEKLDGKTRKRLEKGATSFLRELGWREFAYHLLYHFPKTPDEALKDPFKDFPWKKSKKNLRAWQKGETGYPVVDAAMRNLWETGWMPNRARMVVASFLTKDLLLPWQAGAKWFWDTLVDADLANNTLGWQWTAGCGADAAPFFRIFNPVKQGEKFDPEAAYVRRWAPEIERVPDKYIQNPWDAPQSDLKDAGVTIGETYPKPIVDHSEAREKALDAYDSVR